MRCPNLFRCLTVFCIATSWCATGVAGPPGHWQPPGIHIPRSQYQAPIIDYYMGQKPQLWDNQQPVEHFLGELGKRSWMRFDYIHWEFATPDSGRVGAPVSNLIEPLQVADNLNNGALVGVGIIPNRNNLSLNDTPGARGTWGVDLANAEFELEFFGTGESEDTFRLVNLSAFRPPTIDPVTGQTSPTTIGTIERPNVVVPLLLDGAVSDAGSANYLIFDDSFSTSIKSRMWGAEASLLSKSYVPGAGLAWQWLGGFRYLSYDEEYSLRGTRFEGATTAATSIGARTTNNMYGPEFGARASIVNRWFSLTATPRIAFTLDNYSADAHFNGTSVADQQDIEFTPIVQLSLAGEIHVTPNFSIFGGYDFMWIYRMTRPFDNIVYDSTPGAVEAFDTVIGQKVDLESFDTRGLSFGCVLRY